MRHNLNKFETFFILDAFCSPSQNVLGTSYLSRIIDETDPRGLGYDFFTFDFDEQIHPTTEHGVVYAFPPRPLELAACRHIKAFKPRCWALILAGENLSKAVQILREKFDLYYTRFAIKGHKQALTVKAPSYHLMLLMLKPKKMCNKRSADGGISDVVAKYPR